MAPNDSKSSNSSKDGRGRKKKQPPTITSSQRVTRLMTTDAARRAVFNTAELLEHIFLHLPPNAMVGSQRVCRQFRDIVRTSHQIKQALFTELRNEEGETWVLTYEDARNGVFTRKTKAGEFVLELVVPARLNSLFTQSLPNGGGPGGRAYSFETIEPTTNMLRGMSQILRGEPSPICSAMYITDTPCTKVELILSWEVGSIRDAGYAFGNIHCYLENAKGFTIGEMLQKALETPYVQNFQKKDGTGRLRKRHRTSALRDVLQDVRANGNIGGLRLRGDMNTYFKLVSILFPTDEERKMVKEQLP